MSSKRKQNEDSNDISDEEIFDKESDEETFDKESEEEKGSSDSSSIESSESESTLKRKSLKIFKREQKILEPEEESEPPAEIEVLKNLLTNIQSSGEYTVGGEANELPPYLGLKIKDFGYVPLPLNKLLADELLKLCKIAPYGNYFDMVYDPDVRDTYQLEPSSIEIENPEWNTKLQLLVDRVSKSLGCNGKVEAKLYKLLLYKTSGHFKKHRDTEKDKNMFGTLILQLPSIHEGGDLVVYNRDKSESVFDFGKSTNRASYAVHFAAHYADAEHEVRKVISGYRLALVYSLCWLEGNGKTIIEIELVKKLRESLSKVKGMTIGVMLSHKYTLQSLEVNGIRALKGIDNDRFSVLDAANSLIETEDQFDFNIACVNLEVTIERRNKKNKRIDDKIVGFIEAWYDLSGKSLEGNQYDFNKFSYVIDLDKGKVFSNKTFGSEQMYDESDIRDKDDEVFGNDSVNIMTLYSKYILVLVPKKTLASSV